MENEKICMRCESRAFSCEVHDTNVNINSEYDLFICTLYMSPTLWTRHNAPTQRRKKRILHLRKSIPLFTSPARNPLLPNSGKCSQNQWVPELRLNTYLECLWKWKRAAASCAYYSRIKRNMEFSTTFPELNWLSIKSAIKKRTKILRIADKSQ